MGNDDINLAFTSHYTTKTDLEKAGMGNTIMDKFSDGFCISSVSGMGTKLTIKKNLITNEEIQRETL